MWTLLLWPPFCGPFIPNTWMDRDPESKECKRPTLHSSFSISWQAPLLIWRADRGADCQRITSSTRGIKPSSMGITLSEEQWVFPSCANAHFSPREMVPQVPSEQPTDDAVERKGNQDTKHLFPCCPLRLKTWTVLSKSTHGILLAVSKKRLKIALSKMILKSDSNYTAELVRKNILLLLHIRTFSNRWTLGSGRQDCKRQPKQNALWTLQNVFNDR